MKQSEIIKLLSAEELKRQILYSQSLFFLLSIILSFFLFNHITDWFDLIYWDLAELFYYGVIPGIIIVSIDILLMRIFPKRYFDDGGINEKIFKNQSFISIFILTLTIAIAEEFLFRGLIQSVFGYFFASILFTLVHLRYLAKPVLLVSVLLTSFYIGFLFEQTGNLLVTITAHFVVDFLLGIMIRLQKEVQLM